MAVRADVVLAAVVGVIVVAAAASAIGASGRTVASFAPDSPAATVQTYLAAVADGDLERAATQLSTAGGCTAQDLDSTYLPTSFRAVLEDQSDTGSTAVVTVQITESGGSGPFDEGYSHSERLFLVREDGAWRLSGTPWPLYVCPSVVKR
jgi:hypothetical protein